MFIEDVFKNLDEWVKNFGNGKYVGPKDTLPGDFQLSPEYGIQQCREEIFEFTKMLIEFTENLENKNILEIGLGYFGSTHYLFRQIFNRVVTIEKSIDRCKDFNRNFYKFGKNELGNLQDGKSSFIYGYSYEPSTLEKIESLDLQFDVLFIDGDHQFKSALSDFLQYEKFVRAGGIIAFHDTALFNDRDYGVPKLISKIKSGKFGNYKVNDIIKSESLGISYFYK